MNITPDPRYLTALVNQNLSWREALGELMDNSFDARATRVEIDFASKTLTVRDDGDGSEDVAAMLTLGSHAGTAHTKLGRFGVGLKDAAVWLASSLDISTVRMGQLRVCKIDWDLLLRAATWDVPDPVMEPTQSVNGTTLTFRGVRRAHPPFESLIDALGFTFMPALRSGKQIVVRHGGRQTVCKPYELPPLESIVEDVFDVRGKSVRLRAGIVKSGSKNQHPGFIFVHAFRVIEESSLGANGYSTSQVTGIVELDRKWDLGKNKSKLTDVDAEALGEAIYARCREMLEKASQRARNIELDNLTGKAQALISDALSDVIARERRGRGTSKGTAAATASNLRRINVGMIQPGPRDLKHRSGGVSLDWNAYGDERLGEVDLTSRRITLNLDHPALDRMRQSDNPDGIAALALTVFCVQVFEREAQGKFAFARNHSDVMAALGPILAGWKPQSQHAKLSSR